RHRFRCWPAPPPACGGKRAEPAVRPERDECGNAPENPDRERQPSGTRLRDRPRSRASPFPEALRVRPPRYRGKAALRPAPPPALALPPAPEFPPSMAAAEVAARGALPYEFPAARA